MTGRRYEARNDELPTQVADLTRRVERLEAALLGQPGVGIGSVTVTDFNTPPMSTTSGSFQFAYYLYLNGPAQGLEAYFRVVTPVGVTMQIRIVDEMSFTVISPVVTIPANTDAFTGIRARGPSGLNIIAAHVEIRVASGAGTVRIGLLRAIGGNYMQGTF